MSKIVKRSRGERGSRKLDMSAVRAALRDRRYWTGLGLVYKPNGESAHYEFDADIGVLVHVQLMPDKEPLMCRLGGLGEGGTSGVWRIPPVGTEVAVGIPGGELDNDPMIIGVLASGDVPGDLDDATLVVRGPKIVIVPDAGSTVSIYEEGNPSAAKPLPYYFELMNVYNTLEALRVAYATHVHLDPVSGSTGGPSNAAPLTCDTPNGTSVLKAQ